jgi:hypothetical protein
MRKSALNFDELVKQQSTTVADVYVRSPLNSLTTFWFVGKVACTLEATPTQAVIAQKRLILEYSKGELRPQNFAGKYAKELQVWLAPGNSEMDVVQNKITLEQVTGNAQELVDFDLSLVGFNPEIYVGDEKTKGGLRVELDETGRPIKPVFDVNESL